MAKSLFVFIVLLIASFCISGCAAVEPKAAETSKIGGFDSRNDSVQAGRYETERTQNDKIKPVDPGQVQFEYFKPDESNSVQSDRAELDDPEPARVVTFHKKCADILNEYVNDYGMVDYDGLRRKRLELRALLREFDKLNPDQYESWPREDKIAFWINVYNLQKLSVITDNYPIEPASRILTIFYRGTNSIRHIEDEIAGHKFLVMDEEFTFSIIEKRFFRDEFDDPRIFFAITSGCLSSPPLGNEPYYGHKLDEQLDEQTERFLSSSLAFSIDREDEKVYLSALFQSSWYGREFINKFGIDRKFKDHPPETRAVLNFITGYIPEEDVTFLETGNYTINYMAYDWSINDSS